MKVSPTPLSGVLIIDPQVFRDSRGFFLETFHQKKYAQAGIAGPFVQDNHSRSTRGTLRGLHAQLTNPQGKLVRVVHGRILDVVVDIRRGSPTFKRWIGIELSDENFRQCFVPPGFAHGFYTLSDEAEMEYKCTDFYQPNDELHLRWDDPDIGIEWPAGARILSEKDRQGISLREAEARLPVYQATPRNQ